MARIDLGWENGRRRRKTIYGPTRKAVAAQLPKLLQSAQAGTVITDERQTVAAYLSSWLDYKRPRLRARAFATYQQAVERHLVPGIGKVPLSKLTPQQLERWFTEHQTAGASARTIRYARAVLRAALNQALKWNLVVRNVAALVDPPRHQAHEIQPLTPEQARTLLASVREHRLGAIVSVATAVGLRQGEALGLRWADVDFAAGTLRVQQALEGGKVPSTDALERFAQATRTRLRIAFEPQPAR
jgi:integrase